MKKTEQEIIEEQAAKAEELQKAVDDALIVFVDTKWYEAYKHLSSIKEIRES